MARGQTQAVNICSGIQRSLVSGYIAQLSGHINITDRRGSILLSPRPFPLLPFFLVGRAGLGPGHETKSGYGIQTLTLNSFCHVDATQNDFK